MRWEKLRMKGKTYVVFRTAAIATIFFFVAVNAVGWVITGNPLPTALYFLFPVLGLITAFIHWSVNESRFEGFLADKRVRAAARSKK